MTDADLVRELQELIQALDRRVPRVEQAGEAAIARDAARLREKAMIRLAELSDQSAGTAAGAPERDTETVSGRRSKASPRAR